MRDLTLDLRYALRMIRKRPTFAAVAVLVLALGIGANSAVFSLVNALILRPLSFPQLDRLVEIRDASAHQEKESVAVTPADYFDWKQRATSFQSISGWTINSFDLASEGTDPEGVDGLETTADLLHTLGVAPALGRGFRAGED